MTCIEFNVLLKVPMSTYNGNLDDSEWIYENLKESLHDISDAKSRRDNWNVKCKMIDGSEITLKEDDIEPDFRIDWDSFRETICNDCEVDIDGSVRQASDGKFENLSELLEAYGYEYKSFSWFMPKYYNFDNDSLDLNFEVVDEDWSLEKYWLTELVQKYIDEVRVGSYDWYDSFEPSRISDVGPTDYCTIRAILQKEKVFDYIQSELQELVDYHWFEIYDEAASNYHYTWREDTMPDKWTWYYQDRYKLHYFIPEYDGKYLQEVTEETIYPPKKDEDEQ